MPTSEAAYSPYAYGQGSWQDAVANNVTADVIEGQLFFGTGSGTTEDPFWSYAGAIDTARWNQTFPYQLLILDASNNYATLSSFTLPIAPQELGLSTPFAISTQVTLGGIVEQHNGAPLRTITLSGTTGMWTGRSHQDPFQQPSTAQAIFGGTLGAASNLAQAVGNIGSSSGNQTQGSVVSSQVFAQPDPGGSGSETGYYQFRLLQQFLESYVTAKKSDAGLNLRLAFAIWKDQAVYLVTPVVFEMKRSQASPWEYMFSLQLRAWKRIPYTVGGSTPLNSGASVSNNNPSAIVNLVNAVNAAQTALQVGNLVAVLQGATGDANNLLETLRSTSAWGKDQVGQVYNMADLPDQVVNSLKGPVVAALANPNLSPPNINADFQQLLTDLGVSSNLASTQNANPSGQGQNLSNFQGPNAAHNLNTIFANPKQYYQYFSSVNTSYLNIPTSIQAKITAERQRLRNFSRQDFANMLDQIQTASENFADFVGAGDDTFNATYNRTPIPSTRTPSDNDFQVLFALNSVIMEMNRQAAYNNVGSAVPTNPMDFAAGFFANTDITFSSYPGKFAVPFPYGATLEVLAIQYLDDIDRWEEIATLNNLREPYVDETGFTVPFLTNGNGSQVTVASAQNLEVNQLVYVSANGQPRSPRHILSITPINNGAYYVLVLDGLPNMGNYKTAFAASLQAYLPGTVNSQMTLYIPTKVAPPVPQYDTPGIPGVNPYQEYFNLGGVDLLLTSTGDLVITPDGDCRLAIGLTNLTQSAWLAFNTPKGNLKRHLEYGFPRIVGQSVADLPASSIVMAAKDLFKDDPSFSGVKWASVQIAGPAARINVGVGLANSSQVLPIAFDVR